MLILYRVAPIKVYLTIYEGLKSTYLKISFRTINKRFWLALVQGLSYMKTTALGLNLVYSFVNFLNRLPLTFVRHSWGNNKRLARHLLK